MEAVVLAVIIAPILGLVAWGLVRIRHARVAIRASLAEAGLEIVRMDRRLFRLGPFFWTTSRGQIVYRLVVREHDGRQRTGWARWGRSWLFKPDTLELRWDR